MWKSRQDVINTLRNSTLLSVTEVKFNNEFSIPFNVGSTMFYLNVVIPDAFPSQPLKVTLSPPAQHPLVNEKFQVVGSPAINGAISMQCNLESIVADAIQDLKTPPPMLISKSDDSKSAATSSQANLDTPNNINSQPHVPSAPSLAFISPHSGNSPDSDPTMKQYCSRIYQWLPESVINKDESELKDILASEEEMLELQLKSPVTAHMNQQIQSLVDETEQLAHANLSMEAVWKERSSRLSTCIEKLHTLTSDVSSLQSKLAQAIDEQGPESQYYNLQVAVLEADEECEKVSRRLFSSTDNYSSSSLSSSSVGGSTTQSHVQSRVESFIEEYREKRKLYHLRKAKQEQFARLLIMHNNNSSTSGGSATNSSVSTSVSSSKT